MYKNIRLKYILFLIIIVTSLVFGQISRKRWVIISDVDNRITYIDTSSITYSTDQISVWSLTKYRKPIDIQPFQQKIARVKSNYLFNTLNNKYSIIGAIYFDKMGKIVGQSNNPNVASNRSLFINNVESGSIHEILLAQSQGYINNGILTIDVKQNNRSIVKKTQPDVVDHNVRLKEKTYVTPDESDSIKYSVGVDLQNEIISSAMEPTEEDDSETFVDDEPDVTDQQSEIGNQLRNNLIDTNPPAEEEGITPPPPDENLSASREILVPYDPYKKRDEAETEENEPEPEKKKPAVHRAITSADYDSANESIVEGTIWSDGQYFCFQVSSWTSNSKANHEANRLKNKGHKAFVVKAFVKNRNRNYYRVRIGYFYTLNEAKNSQQSL